MLSLSSPCSSTSNPRGHSLACHESGEFYAPAATFPIHVDTSWFQFVLPAAKLHLHLSYDFLWSHAVSQH